MLGSFREFAVGVKQLAGELPSLIADPVGTCQTRSLASIYRLSFKTLGNMAVDSGDV